MYDTLGLVAKGDFTPISISNCAATFNKKGHFTPIWISNCVPPIKHADKGNPGGTWAIRGTGLPLQGASLTFNTKSYNLYLTAKRLNLIFIGTKTKGGGQCDGGRGSRSSRVSRDHGTGSHPPGWGVGVEV